MDIKSGLAMVVFVWVGIGACFGVACLIAKFDRWIHPLAIIGVIVTALAFFLGSLIRK